MGSNAIRLDIDPGGIPNELTERRAWVCWRIETRDGHPTKVPIDPTTGGRASSTDDGTWSDFATALEYHESETSGTAGLGFVFSPTGPFVGVDLDDCREPDSGDLEEWAHDVLLELDTFAEVSPSGTGAHAIGRGEVPGDRNWKGNVEIYDQKRFFTVTGYHLEVTPDAVEPFQNALEAVHAEYIGGTGEADESPTHGHENRPSEPTDLDSHELVKTAKNAGNGRKFERLWRGDTSGYDSHSEARMALLNMLAFWTGGNTRQMDRLFRDSGLYPHPSKSGKWDRVGADEIRKAIQN